MERGSHFSFDELTRDASSKDDCVVVSRSFYYNAKKAFALRPALCPECRYVCDGGAFLFRGRLSWRAAAGSCVFDSSMRLCCFESVPFFCRLSLLGHFFHAVSIFLPALCVFFLLAVLLHQITPSMYFTSPLDLTPPHLTLDPLHFTSLASVQVCDVLKVED